MRKIVVVLSGGLDSTTLLYHVAAVKSERKIEDFTAVTFSYDQRHHREVVAAGEITRRVGCEWNLISLPIGPQLPGSSQTDRTVDVPHGHYADEMMRATVVPNRNMIFLSVAAAFAIAHGFDTVAYGAHAGDHAIYPDCRPEFVEAMKHALRLCHYEPVELYTPFLHFSKREIAEVGKCLRVPFEETWTCYEGGDAPCGKCGACIEREEALR